MEVLLKNRQHKLREQWALALYVLTTIGTLTYAYIMYTMKTKQGEATNNMKDILAALTQFNSRLNYRDLGFLFATNLVRVMAVLVVILGFMYCFPSAFIYTSFGLNIAFTVISLILTPSLIILSGIGLLVQIGFVYFVIWPNRKFLAALAKASSRLCIKYFFTFTFVSILANLPIMVLCAVFSFFLQPVFKNSHPLVYAVPVFWFYWGVSFSLYFSKVFISSVIVYDTAQTKSGQAVIGPAYKNTLYASGSIAVAALISAIAKTVQSIIESMKNKRARNDRDSRQSGGELVVLIILLIASLIANLIGSLVEHLNSFALPYLALYGCSYKDAITGSFAEVYCGLNNKAIAGISAMDQSNGLISAFKLCLLAVCNFYTFKKLVFSVGAGQCSVEQLVASFFVLVCTFVIEAFLDNIISSVGNTLIFIEKICPNVLSEEMPKEIYEPRTEQESAAHGNYL
ncbi:hypothetical protein ENBRE01_2717 [Enteropsectra breve]|nr:hypothetical protein ENBRE01_2717 [Enteropsectra breve]